jgi:hypothetical protein
MFCFFLVFEMPAAMQPEAVTQTHWKNCLEAIDGLAQLVQDSQRIADECRGAIFAASLKQ